MVGFINSAHSQVKGELPPNIDRNFFSLTDNERVKRIEIGDWAHRDYWPEALGGLGRRPKAQKLYENELRRHLFRGREIRAALMNKACREAYQDPEFCDEMRIDELSPVEKLIIIAKRKGIQLPEDVAESDADSFCGGEDEHWEGSCGFNDLLALSVPKPQPGREVSGVPLSEDDQVAIWHLLLSETIPYNDRQLVFGETEHPDVTGADFLILLGNMYQQTDSSFLRVNTHTGRNTEIWNSAIKSYQILNRSRISRRDYIHQTPSGFTPDESSQFWTVTVQLELSKGPPILTRVIVALDSDGNILAGDFILPLKFDRRIVAHEGRIDFEKVLAFSDMPELLESLLEEFSLR
ncbi:MAG: hypothetical protein EA369_09660 [Bradymonadales bacterium]|nr:MAG: hypothetical protein EA369_09660 [Bradymonadales bacterium]